MKFGKTVRNLAIAAALSTALPIAASAASVLDNLNAADVTVLVTGVGDGTWDNIGTTQITANSGPTSGLNPLLGAETVQMFDNGDNTASIRVFSDYMDSFNFTTITITVTGFLDQLLSATEVEVQNDTILPPSGSLIESNGGTNNQLRFLAVFDQRDNNNTIGVDFSFDNVVTPPPPAVPLPAGAVLMLTGLGVFGLARRRRRG